jgi:hypothetical protein
MLKLRDNRRQKHTRATGRQKNVRQKIVATWTLLAVTFIVSLGIISFFTAKIPKGCRLLLIPARLFQRNELSIGAFAHRGKRCGIHADGQEAYAAIGKYDLSAAGVVARKPAYK